MKLTGQRKTMLTFNEYLNEALVTFNKKAYPKYGQFVILAGGSGSGKGWVIKNLLGISAKVLDVDHIKELVLKSDKLRSGLDKKYGRRVGKEDLKNPEFTSDLHHYVDKELDLPNKEKTGLRVGVTNKNLLPNIIADNTLDTTSRLESLCSMAKSLGYSPENIHIVWVVNDVNVALNQNSQRDRVVDPNIVIQKHTGVANTLKNIYQNVQSLSGMMNGDIWFVFNNSGVDVHTVGMSKGSKRGYVSKATYQKVKEAGSSSITPLKPELVAKLQQYTPTGWK